MKKIILASSSPRRKQMMQDLFGKDFIIEKSNYEEDNSSGMQPALLAESNAIGKARDVAKKHNSGIIIAADSFVVLGNKILGKPKNENDAFDMLKAQSGKWTEVVSGLAVIDTDTKKEYVMHEITKLKMAKMSENEILDYIATKEPMDKAGAFGIQGKGGVFVEKINGCYSNVVGLPLPELLKILKKLKIRIFCS